MDPKLGSGGYIKMSTKMELPLRIGVKRPVGDKPPSSAGAKAAKGIGGMFNLFGSAG
tara:strand:+ start:246 stop:416 length:171 start_codon:yes stop_codon:yes gene_type:complete